MSLDEKLSRIKRYSEELGLDLTKPDDRFKWFIASILFAKRISAEIAKKTFRQFENEGLTSPERILEAGWNKLVDVLDSGGYVRYDFSTASNLLAIMKKLKEEYGDLEIRSMFPLCWRIRTMFYLLNTQLLSSYTIHKVK